MGAVKSCLFPKEFEDPDSKSLLSENLEKYEVIIHRPLSNDALQLLATEDNFRVTEVDSYILQAAGVKKNHRIVQIGYKPVKTGPNGYDPIVAIKKNKKFPLALIFSRPRDGVVLNAEEEDSSDSDLFTRKTGTDLYDMPPEDVTGLNSKQQQERLLEAEAALQNFKKLHKSYQQTVLKDLKEEKKKWNNRESSLKRKHKNSLRNVEDKLAKEKVRPTNYGSTLARQVSLGYASTVGTSVASSVASDFQRREADLVHGTGALLEKDGFLNKYGQSGRKGPKRKYVKFYYDESEGEKKVILEYSEKENDNRGVTHQVDRLGEENDIEGNLSEKEKQMCFVVWVQDKKKNKEKGLVFECGNSDAREQWDHFIQQLLGRKTAPSQLSTIVNRDRTLSSSKRKKITIRTH